MEPDFGLSGALAAETNLVGGVALLHQEPAEARKPPGPPTRWRLYGFKGEEALGEPLALGGRSTWLVGRERKVADIPMDHPSVSKQHAVLQWRLTTKEVDFLDVTAVRLYVMDLGSANGTLLSGRKLEPQKYVELLHQDTLRFGNSSREFVVIHDAKG